MLDASSALWYTCKNADVFFWLFSSIFFGCAHIQASREVLLCLVIKMLTHVQLSRSRSHYLAVSFTSSKKCTHICTGTQHDKYLQKKKINSYPYKHVYSTCKRIAQHSFSPIFPSHSLAKSMALSLVCSLLFGKFISETIHRYIPYTEKERIYRC